MKYEIREDLVETFEIESVEIVEEDIEAGVRRWIAIILLLTLALLILGGLALSFKSNDTDVFKSLLNAVTPLVAIAIGYYFGTKKGG